MTKILIFGAHGQLARSLAALDTDFELVHTTRPETDLCKLETIERAIGTQNPQFVINAAAYTQVDKAETDADMAFAVNALGTGYLADQCAKNDIPLLHVSTDYVYDGSKATPYTEADPTGPIGVYGKSKLSGENLVRAAGGKHIILRTSWVFSPFGGNFVKTMLNLAESRDQLSVVSDQLGCPTYAPHLADGMIQIVQQLVDNPQLKPAWGTYCMAGNGEASWYQFAQEIFKTSKNLGAPSANVEPVASSAFPTAAKRPSNSRMDCRKLEQQFGVRLPDWHQGVEACVTALLAKPNVVN